MITIKRKSDFRRHLYEKEAWAQGEVVCGIDEVGRSCLAGPVVAAALILHPHVKHTLLKDSKLLTADERVKAYKWLTKNSVWSIGIMHHRIIDGINIYQATLSAMKRALIQLLSRVDKQPSIILVDAMPVALEQINIPIVHFPFGERQSLSIAGASIVAKVTRDALMTRLDGVIPGYVFQDNKGYGTPVHKKALKEQGASMIHRVSFKWSTTPQEML